MKYNRYLPLLLSLCISLCTRAQYNPNNPDEPGARPWRLTLKADPAKAESFNRNSVTNHAAGEQFYIHAYDHSGFKFVQWEDEQGSVITKERGFDYTMPARHVTLTARYEYSPDTPNEPGQATIMRHLYLKSNPPSGGYFNYGSANDVASGEQVTLRAYPNKHYSFRNWTKDGEIISTSAMFVYTMPERDATLTANFDYHYSPDNPHEPSTLEGSRCNLYAMREGVLPGQAYTYSIYMENVGVGATGFSLEVNFPQGFKVAQDAISLTSRATNHTLKVENTNDGGFRFIVRGAAAIEGVGGKVLEIPIQVPDTATIGNVFPVELKNGLVFKSDGQQISIGVRSGSLQILRSADEKPNSPDYVVTNLQTSNTSVMPGDIVHLSWQVSNQGNLAGSGGWTERLYLLSPDGRKVGIGTVSYEISSLAVGAVVSRSADIVLAQLLGIDGKVDLGVTVVPAVSSGEVADFQLNNSAQTADTPLTVGKRLCLTVPQTPQQEGQVSTIRCQLSRSGNWTNSETFQLTKLSGDDRLIMPETVTIPRDQASAYFYIPLSNNAVCDADSIVSIRIEGQGGYDAVEGTFIVRDDELPPLRLTASATDINEGDTFQLTVSIDHPLSTDLTVALTCDHPTRFNYPKTIVLSQGQTAATVELTAIDDSNPSSTETVEFYATAEGYGKAHLLLMLYDNDVPDIDLELTPNTVNEDAGANAVYAILKRTKVINNKVTIRLTDDQTGRLVYPTTVVLEKGVTEKAISIGVVDNNLVEGESIVNLKAEVYISSCDCGVVGAKQATVIRQLRILDDDGPTLKISPAGTAMLEGSEGNVFAISHNVQSDVDVVVHISSDKDDMLEYDHELTIPAGQTSANLLVNVKNNDQEDDNSIAAFKAEANGYTMGTCWILITDQTLPDATISLYTDKTEVEAEQTVLLRAVVKNVGNASLRSTTPVKISFSGRSEKVKLTVGKTVAVGDSAVIEYNYDLPAITGNHTFEATVNASGKVPELIYANNTSELVNISLISPFSVTAKADKKIYAQSDSIHIMGTATGSAGRNAKIEVYFINEGSRQTVNVTSDNDGNYATAWKPLNKQSGHFIVGACYPGSKATEEMDAFDVYGIRTKDNFKTCELNQTETITGKIILSNPGNLKQSGLTITPKTDSENCKFTFNAPSVIGAGKSVEIAYTVEANEITEGRDWQQMPIEITTDEGSLANYTIYYYVHSLKARLQANMTSINTTMTLGTSREYPVTIRNVGKAETGKITLALPSWIQTVTPKEMASLAQGDSATILLRFMPTESMKLNVRVSGHIGINCANGDGTAISFNLTPVSDEKGKLKVDVVDEYTFFTNEAPHVSKAKVRVKNPSTNEVVAEGETADDGTFSAELPEGYYSVTVDADKHDNYVNTVIVDPGVEKEEEVFLSYQAITYSWNVEETGVEDEYEIETIVKYETRVPKPVVIITLPDEQPEPNSIIPVVLTNKGLINAVDVNLSLSISDGYTLEFLNDPSLEVLAPQQSHVFYAKMVPETDEEASARARRASSNSSICFTLIARARYKELCQKYTGEELAEQIKKWGTRHCLSSGLGGDDGGSHGGNGGYGPGDGPDFWDNITFGDKYLIWDTDDPAKFCDKKPDNNDNDENNPSYVPETDPEENEDCEEAPELHYTLISNDGHRYEMKGVAADGVSQVLIVFDPKHQSYIPKDDCDWTCHWSLVDDNGKIGKLTNVDSWDNVIYTAPEDYPNESGSEMTITARIDVYKNGEWLFSKDQSIALTRVPLVLVNGFFGLDNWASVKQDLFGCGMYREFQVLNNAYPRSGLASLEHNAHLAYNNIRTILRKYRDEGYVASKSDLMGYSMGGILSRLCVQECDYRLVHKLVTVSTPHSGSEISDIWNGILQSAIVTTPSLRLLKVVAGDWFYDNFGATVDLGVNSPKIDSYLNGNVNNTNYKRVPVHAVSSYATDLNSIIETCLSNTEQAQQRLEEFDSTIDIVKFIFDNTGFSNIFPSVVYLYSGLALTTNAEDVLLEEVKFGLNAVKQYLVDNKSDYVVSLVSQTGGCEKTTVLSGPNHINVMNDLQTRNTIKNLLRKNVNSGEFSYKWFHPDDIKIGFSKPNISSMTRKVMGKIPEKKLVNSSIPLLEYVVENDSILNVFVNDSSFDKYILFGDIEGKGSLFAYNGAYTTIIPNCFVGKIKIYALLSNNEKDVLQDSIEIEVAKPRLDVVSIESDNIYINSDDQCSPVIRVKWSNGSQTYTSPKEIIFEKGVAVFQNGVIKPLHAGKDVMTISFLGKTCTTNICVYDLNNDNEDVDDEESNSICSTVTLSFKQKNVMTRQAFRGTLTVNNGNDTTAMKVVKLNLEVRDMDGSLMTSHEFQIDAESLNGFTGNLDFNSGWTLEGGGTGEATILFIPTKYAAPTEPKDYSFGGSFSYTDPYTGLTVTRDLNPVTLTVNPSPNLEMTYFMQRDVFGDDPLTETVEPMIPSEFALIVNNKGYGDAENMSLTTHQPEIIDNQKGLAISFELISTQLNGGDKNLSLGGSMTSDFGTIPAHSQAYAQWWLQSSLLGHFIEYNVKATHLTSRNNPDLSLLDTVTVHELIHGFTARTDSDKPLRGFLVNDIKDREDLPDIIYFTDATQKNVGRANINVNKVGRTDYQLNVTSSMAGWSYASIPDPTDGKQKLVSIIRQSDGESIPVDNVWQTWCTLKDGKDPVHERRLHFIGNIPAEGQSYLLSFEARPDMELEVESFKGGPESDVEQKTALKEVTVVFNKPIEASTFTTDDVSLQWQGSRLNVSEIVISQQSGTEFKLNLEKLTSQSGYYVLTVLTENIKDTEGFSGTKSSHLAWTQVVDASGIHALEANDGLSIIISPIPVTDRMQICGNFKTIQHLSVYSLNGISKLQVHNVEPNTSIDVSKLRPGVYIVNIQTDMGVYRARVLKE